MVSLWHNLGLLKSYYMFMCDFKVQHLCNLKVSFLIMTNNLFCIRIGLDNEAPHCLGRIFLVCLGNFFSFLLIPAEHIHRHTSLSILLSLVCPSIVVQWTCSPFFLAIEPYHLGSSMIDYIFLEQGLRCKHHSEVGVWVMWLEIVRMRMHQKM